MPAQISDGLTITPLTSDPAGWPKGSIYFNTTSGLFRGFDGNNWSDIGAEAGFYYVPSTDVVVVPVNKVVMSYYHSKTDGRVVISGILSASAL